MPGEEGGGEHGVNGDLGGAAHVGRQQNGHLPVPVRGHGAGGHDGGNGAAEADEHGHEAPARQADLPQQPVHDEGHPGHVARVLQDGQEEEKGHDNGQKAQYAAHSGEDAVDDQAVDHGIDAVGGQSRAGEFRHLVDAQAQPVGQRGADDAEGQPEHQEHDTEEHRQSGVLARQHLVQLHAPVMLPALMALHHGGGHHALDEGVAHIRQGGVAVQTGLRLHLQDAVFQQLLLVLVQLQLVRHGRVPLHQLGGAEPGGQSRPVGVVLNEMDDGVDAAVDRRLRRAEVRHLGIDPAPGGGHRLVDQLRHALAFGGGDGHHGDAQLGAEPLHVDGAAVGPDLVHHVQGQHHGHPQLQQLEGQIQVPLDVGGVHDVDDAVGLSVEDEIPGDDLLLGVGPQGVDARQVHHRAVLLAPDLAHLLVHRHAGEVAHVLVGAGEGVEQSGLAAVLVAGQSEDHTRFPPAVTSMFRASSTRRVSS